MFVDELLGLLKGDTVFPGRNTRPHMLVRRQRDLDPAHRASAFRLAFDLPASLPNVEGQGRFLVPVLDLNVFRQIGKVNEPTSLFSRRAGSVSFRSFGFSSDCASWLACLSSPSASRCRLRAR